MENTICYLDPSWNSLVFEKRNKAFGAYRLREQYHKNVLLGLLTCALFTTFSFCVPTILALVGSTSVPLGKSNKTIDGIIFTTPPPLALTPPLVKPKDPIIKVKNTNLPPKVVTDPVPDETLQPIKPMDVDPQIIENGSGTVGIEVPEQPLALVKPKEPYSVVEIMPMYEGGLENLYKFLGKNLRYPSIDRRNGLEGTVYVQFVIDEIGNVTNISVIKGLSATLDEEAKRVFALMRPWKPGIQNHEAVSVKMIVPIKFKLTT
jgi:protein TonB